MRRPSGPARPRRFRHPALVAVLLFVTASVLGAGYGLLPARSDQQTRITAQFDNAVGLYEGNTVAVLGMPVGQVERITARGGYVEVVLSVRGEVRIPEGVRAVTVGTSILTDRHVELTPAYTGGPTLPAQAVLGLDRTRTPVEFDRVIGMVDKLGVALRGDGTGNGPLAEVLTATSGVAVSSGAELKAALAQLAEALRTGADGGAATREHLETIVRNLGTLTEAAARNEEAITAFGSGVAGLSALLAAENVGQGATGQRLDTVLSQLNTLLSEQSGNLRATVTSSTAFTRALVDYRRELAEVFDLAPLAVDNVYNAIDQKNGYLRVGAHFDNVFFDSSMTKEVCNILGLRQLGCATGELRDMGPDFGITAVLEAMTRTGR
ncbi:MlaD family protein [Nocardia sp. NPDC048505]|uniref:MlaD family protein n=1 Tax=unclassified Nocardia TaxID=2637762 RepID=UPI0033E5B412